MEKEVKEIFTDKVRGEAARIFKTTPDKLKLLGDSENYVYEYPYKDTTRILRVTHSSNRTVNQILGEIDWLTYLADNGVPAARAYDSPQGNLVERVDARNGSHFLVVSFEKAPGRILGPGEWTPDLIEEWGRIVGMIHRLTRNYPDPGPERRRDHWHEFDYLNARKYLPPSESVIIDKTERLVEKLKRLPMDNQTYGLVHSDASNANLLVDRQGITVVDFDDTQHFWVAGDIATILFYSRWLGGKDANMAEFVRSYLGHFWKGYEKENHLEEWRSGGRKHTTTS